MTEKNIIVLLENIHSDFKSISYSGAQGYLNILRLLFKIVPEGKRDIRKAPLGYRTVTKFWQRESRKDFNAIHNIFMKYDLCDEKFAQIRKILTKKNSMHLQSLISNLDSVYSISKNNNFRFKLYKGKEEMEFFIHGLENFKLNQTEVVKEGISSLSIAS